MKRYVFAGGGSAGHALPSLRVAHLVQYLGAEVFYLGGAGSIEERLAAHFGIEFHPIDTRKFDRSNKLSVVAAAATNLRGIWQASRILRLLRPDGVFASGGFASVPVVIAGSTVGVPKRIVHACDLSLGLANQICMPFATGLSCTFQDSMHLSGKAFHSGPIVDAAVRPATPSANSGKRTLLVYGGSQGSEVINRVVRARLVHLLARFDIQHVCGTGKIDDSLRGVTGYEQHEYVMDFPALLRGADVAICRAGSSSLWELVLTGTPHLAVPLPKGVSRGDQVENCKYFERRGVTDWIDQSELPGADLAALLGAISDRSAEIRSNMDTMRPERPAVEVIAERLLA